MKTKLSQIVPVLPSADIQRDVDWYEKLGFELRHQDEMYAVMRLETLYLHLQWHADTADDPLLGGSVIKIFLENIQPIFEQFVKKNLVAADKLRLNTPWGTNEFGLYDLNKNAIFFVEDIPAQ